mgnify:CR=1 FL=1
MLSKEELGKYLNKIRIDRDISLREVYKRTGITFSHLSMIENGKRNVTPALLKNLAQLYNIDYIDLYEKAGYIDLIKNDNNSLLKKIGAIPLSQNPNIVKIPILGTVKAGYDYLAQENIIGNIDVETSLVGDGSEYFALRVKGDSMSPIFIEGDTVIIRKQNDCENNEIAIVIVNGDEGTIKKVRKTEQGIILQPLNPAYTPMIFTNEEINSLPITIIGIVKQLKREF